jgi:hypothetical protein
MGASLSKTKGISSHQEDHGALLLKVSERLRRPDSTFTKDEIESILSGIRENNPVIFKTILQVDKTLTHEGICLTDSVIRDLYKKNSIMYMNWKHKRSEKKLIDESIRCIEESNAKPLSEVMGCLESLGFIHGPHDTLRIKAPKSTSSSPRSTGSSPISNSIYLPGSPASSPRIFSSSPKSPAVVYRKSFSKSSG